MYVGTTLFARVIAASPDTTGCFGIGHGWHACAAGDVPLNRLKAIASKLLLVILLKVVGFYDALDLRGVLGIGCVLPGNSIGELARIFSMQQGA